MKKLVAAVIGMAAMAGSAQAHAQAAIVKDGVGIRLTEKFNRFLESQLKNRDVAIAKPVISKPNVSCFDEVGIRNLTVDTHIDDAAFDWVGTDGGLSLIVNLDHITVGGDLYGQDSDTFDLCPSFSVGINSIELDQVTLTMDMKPTADGNYNVFIGFNTPPQIQVGALHVDISGIPNFVEDLVTNQDFIVNFLFDQVNKQLAQRIPDMVKDAIVTGMFTGEAGPFQYGVGATSIGIDENGANALFDTQMSYMGPRPSCVPAGAPAPDFSTRGTAGLGTYGDQSQVELSVADSAVNEVLWAVWSSGLLCYNSETHPLEPFTHVLEGISPAVGSVLKYDISISAPPSLRFDADKTSVALKGFHLEANEVKPDGTTKLLMLVDADMSMGMKIDVDVATNRVLASMDNMSVTFDNLKSEILFSDRPEAEQDLKDFMTGYVVPRMIGQVQNMPVSNAVMPVQGYYVVLDGLHGREGHAVAGISVYGANDPAIDKLAPDTFVDSNPGVVKATKAKVDFHATDDRSGTLLYSWRVDGTAWSTWSEDTEAKPVALTEGTHVFEVKSRDRFQNEDATPATINFDVAAESHDSLNAYFGCDVTSSGSQTAPAGAIAALAGALAVGVIIVRRRSKV